MRLTVTKPDARERLGRIAGASVAVLIFATIGWELPLTAAALLALVGGMGFLLTRLLRQPPADAPAPRPLPRRWSRGVFRRAAVDQPFSTRLGWTSGSEPGGTLPDARKVTPYGLTGGGLYTDGVVALLVGAAILAMLFLEHPLTALVAVLYFSVFASACYGALVLLRWLRHR